jgi:voltage-gated potassium channel
MKWDLKDKLLIIILPGLISLSSVGIFLVEGYGDSPFASLFNSLWWTIVTFTTVGYGDMAPTTVEGRVFGILILASGVTINAVIISLVSNLFFGLQSGKERGLSAIKRKQHTLVCSDSVGFLHTVLSEMPQTERDQDNIILVWPHNEHPLLTSPEFKGVSWVSGFAYQTSVLQKASVEQAKVAFVSYQDDSLTLMSVMQIESLSKGQTNTLAQYHGEDFRIHLENVGCDYALDASDLYIPLMAQALLEQGSTSWLQEIILRDAHSPTLQSLAVPERCVGQKWLDYVCTTKKESGVMPLGIVQKDAVLVNPPADQTLNKDLRVIAVCPPATSKGDEVADARPFFGSEELLPVGHIIICSDRQEFIQRLLQEFQKHGIKDEIVVISEVEEFAAEFADLQLEWLHLHSTSEQAFRSARAQEGKVAFIDHQHDGNTLIAVLRMEQVTGGDIFTIASYREDNFDQQLIKAGCDFCIHAEDLVAPLLVQTGLHAGTGQLVEQIIATSAATSRMFVRQLRSDWHVRTWLGTINELKLRVGHLPVGLIKTIEQQPRLLVNPHSQVPVEAGDRLLFLAFADQVDVPEYYLGHHAIAAPAASTTRHLVLPEDDQIAPEEWFRKGTEKMKDPSPEAQREAFTSFHHAAVKGHAKAQFNLGVMHFHGKGVPKNRDEAYYWLREAATNGHAQAAKTIQSFRALQKEAEEADKHVRPLNAELLARLSDGERFWYLQAIVRMVLADGRIDLRERVYLHHTVRALENPAQIRALEEMIVFGPTEELVPLSNVPQDMQTMMMRELVEIAVIEREFSEEEQTLLREIGEKLGAGEALMKEMFNYGQQRLQQFQSR